MACLHKKVVVTKETEKINWSTCCFQAIVDFRFQAYIGYITLRWLKRLWLPRQIRFLFRFWSWCRLFCRFSCWNWFNWFTVTFGRAAPIYNFFLRFALHLTFTFFIWFEVGQTFWISLWLNTSITNITTWYDSRSYCWIFASVVKGTESVKSSKSSEKIDDEMSIEGEK